MTNPASRNFEYSLLEIVYGRSKKSWEYKFWFFKEPGVRNGANAIATNSFLAMVIPFVLIIRVRPGIKAADAQIANQNGYESNRCFSTRAIDDEVGE